MRKTNLKTGVIVMLFFLGFVAVSGAQSQDRKPKNPPAFSELLKEMDSGKDGKLSAAEVKGPLKEIFSEVDINDDGFITEEEFENAPKPKGRAQRN